MSDISRRRGMHPLLAFFLGFLLALIITVGAVAGVVVFALNFKLDKIDANKKVDEDGNTTYLFINADPNNGGVGTIKDLISKISEISKGYADMKVSEIEELIPIMSSLTEKLETELGNYVNLEEGELQEVKLGELSAYMNNLVDRINVAKLIGIAPDNAILLYMGYAVHGAYEDDDGWHAYYKDGEGEEHLVTLELNENGQVIEAYYTDGDGEKQTAGYLTLENATDRVNGVCNDLTIGEIVTIDENDRILGSIKNSTVNTISNDINDLCIQQIFANEVYSAEPATDGGEYPVAQMYLAVADESELYAESNFDANLIYYELKDGKPVLAGNNGKMTQVQYDEDDNVKANYFDPDKTYYTMGVGKILYNASYLYYEKDDAGDYLMINKGADNAGRASAPESGEEIYTYGAAAPLWKLLLHVDNQEQAFTFNNVSTMISNVSKNTKDTSMRELDAAGVLTFKNKSELDTKVTWEDSEGEHEKILGDMELSEVVGVFVLLMNKINSLPALP